LLKVFYQIISGLDVLHKNKYIHRDIKLLNILVYKGGIIKIGDFGISKKSLEFTSTVTRGALSGGRKSTTNQAVGTLFYCFIVLFIIFIIILILYYYFKLI
jgi:NIMA (never in mitosis gene a)-related kinase